MKRATKKSSPATAAERGLVEAALAEWREDRTGAYRRGMYVSIPDGGAYLALRLACEAVARERVKKGERWWP